MKKKDILLMSSEGVFNYFYPTLCLLSNDNQQLKDKVEELEEEVKILNEANDNLKDMLEDSKNRDYNIKLDKILKLLGDKNEN